MTARNFWFTMSLRHPLLTVALACLVLSTPAVAADPISFGGFNWQVRSDTGAPGPNSFDPANVSVDKDGLHLRIVQSGGKWTSAELVTTAPIGFGTYQFEVTGRPDQLDANVVFSLASAPTDDGSGGIDVVFSEGGNYKNDKRLNWTVYPPAAGGKPAEKSKAIAHLTSGASTHSFTWSQNGVSFETLDNYADSGRAIADWNDTPKSGAEQAIPQTPQPVHIGLWLNNGDAPRNGKPVEIVIRSFNFTPAQP